MYFDILTLFPDFFKSPLETSIIKRAIEAQKIIVKTHDIRDYTTAKHCKVDAPPYGGGAGMVMQCQPLFKAIETVRDTQTVIKQKIIFLTPQGQTFSQRTAERLVRQDRLILLCGHYEGIDQRVRDSLIDEEISIGNYVLTGGELPALVLIDAIARLIPGVLGKEESSIEESFSKILGGKKEYPHYTKPAEFRGMKVPEVLLSGHHKNIEEWRRGRCKNSS